MGDNPYQSPAVTRDDDEPTETGANAPRWPTLAMIWGPIMAFAAVMVALAVRAYALSLSFGSPHRLPLLGWSLALATVFVLIGMIMLVCGAAVWFLRRLQ